MVIIFGVWMSPFCLLWLLPLVFTGMAMLPQSLGFHHGKTGICADSRGRWKTNKPLGTYGNWDTALKGMSIMVKKIDKSKAMLTSGFVSSIGQIQTQEKTNVEFGHGSCALQKNAQGLQTFMRDHHYFCDFQCCTPSCFPFCCSFTNKVHGHRSQDKAMLIAI